MTTPGGGPIETAYIEIKPKVSATFAADIRREILPLLKKLGLEAEQAFKQVEDGSRQASLGVRSVTRSLNSASKAAEKFGAQARLSGQQASGAFSGVGVAVQRAAADTESGSNRSRGALAGIGGAFAAMGRAAALGSAAAVAAVGAIGAFGIKAAANLEQIDIAFTGILGSAEKADAFTKRLQEFAARTPFEFEELAKGTQRLLALGQTGDQALATLTTVGDAAAAVGADQTAVNRVIVALAQIQAKGKLSAEELNQVGEALPNLDRGAVIENLAQAFGVTTAKIQEMQQKGLIPADIGTQALLKTLQEVPGALGAMDRQAQTLQGRFSTFKDTIKADFSNALLPVIPQIGSALTQLTGVVSAELQKFGPALGDAISTVTPLIAGLVQALGPVLTTFVQALAPVLASLAPALAPLGGVIATLLTALGPALATLGAALSTIIVAAAPLIDTVFVALGSILTSLSPLFTTFATFISTVLANLQPVLDGILAAILPLVDVLVAALMPVLAELGLAFIALLPSLLPIVESFAEMVVAATPLIQAIGLLLIPVIQALIPVLNIVVTLYLARLQAILEVITFVIRNVVIPGFRQLANDILNFAEITVKAADFAFGWIPGLGGKLQSAANSVAGFRDSVNASLAGIQRDVNINVTTTYTTVRQEINDIDGEKRIARDIRRKAQAGTTVSNVPKPIVLPRVPVPSVPSSGGSGRPGGSKGGGASSAESAAKKAADAAKKRAIEVADAFLAAAKKIADGIKAKLSDAEGRLKDLRDQFRDIAEAVRDAFSIDLFETRSAKQFIKRATKNINKNAAVADAQRVLQSQLGGRAGGSDFLRQLFESGNRKLIENLAKQDSATLQEVLDKFNKDNALATQIGNSVASAFLVGGKPLVVAINNTRDEVIKLRKELAAALAKVEAATKARNRIKAAAGGIFNAATDLQVGEAGREVVVPLTRPSRALELLLQSGALGLPTVTAHLAGLQKQANQQSMIRLRDLDSSGPAYTRASGGSAGSGAMLSAVPSIKVVKERTLNQEIHIHEVANARLTADRVAARTASQMDR